MATLQFMVPGVTCRVTGKNEKINEIIRNMIATVSTLLAQRPMLQREGGSSSPRQRFKRIQQIEIM
jgi:hypothetical protein